MRLNAKIVFWTVLILAAAALAATAHFARSVKVTVEGAVLVEAANPEQQSPLAGVEVTAARGATVVGVRSDANGFFRVELPAGIVPGQAVALAFRHPDYRPLDLRASANGGLVVARMAPLVVPPAAPPDRAQTAIANVHVRYTIEAASVTNVGSGVRMFQAVNTGNVPCEGHQPCSPDGRWRAGIGSATLDAGPDNEFRNASLSCIAGPCAFTRIDTDNFSRGGRVIGATVRAWSDTATFVLQAEVVRPQISNVVRDTYPVILGRTMNFTLPAAAEGPSVEAEVGGVDIVFPLGPRLYLSWAECEARAGGNQSKIFRCQLKPGYRFP